MAWILKGEWCFICIDRGVLVQRTRGATRRGEDSSRHAGGDVADLEGLMVRVKIRIRCRLIVDVISGSLKSCPGHSSQKVFVCMQALISIPQLTW
jgi:hypothetical protein